MPEPVDVDQLRQLHEQAKRAPNGPGAGACIDALPALLDDYERLRTHLERTEDRERATDHLYAVATNRVAAAHDVIRRLRDGWEPGNKSIWWTRRDGPAATHQETTPAERAVLDAVAGPDDTEENR